MTREDIIRMAREAGLISSHECRETASDEMLTRFAALVAAAERTQYEHTIALQKASYEREMQIEVMAERSACADICDQHASIEGIAQRCAAEIRARSKT